ncbi:MAG: ABC transporter permease [Chitinophagaceae bacterium]|nr:ABC transporter permease [Chitinophagaceae bacterium]
MSVCLLIINIIAEQYSYDNFHTKKDRIYRIMTVGAGSNDFKTASSAIPLAKKLKQEYPGIEQSATLVRNIGGDMIYNEKAASGGGYFADGELFKILDFKLSKGNAATALQNPFSLVVTEDIAKLLFGNEEPIGKVIQFNDKGINPGGPEKGNRETAYGNFTITGVLQPVPGKTHLPFKLLASLSTLPALNADKKMDINVNDWNNVWTNYTYVLLDKTKTAADLQNMLNQVSAKQYQKGGPNEYLFKAKALTAITPANPIGNETHIAMPYLLLLIISILGLIVMLSACLNYTNLSVARALSRTKEVGIRKVSGATRTQVFLQFIVEAIVVSLLSLLLAILLLFFLRSAFTGLWFNQFMNISLQQSGWLYLLFILFSLVIGLIAGLLPSIYISAFNPLVMMRNFGGIKMFKRLTLRKALLVVQFSVSLIFIISTVVLYQQTNHLLNFNYGFNKENIINISLYKQENFQRFAQAVASNKDIAAVSACSFMPSTGTQNGTQVYKAENRKDSLQISFMDVDSKFTDVLGLQIKAGKTFPDVADTSGENYVVVNETFVKDFKYPSVAGVIGQRISIEGNTVEIIGVVKDFQFLDVTQQMRPLVLRNRPASFGVASIKVRGTDMAAMVSFLETTWKKVNPNTKFEYQFYDEQLLFTHSMLSDVAKILGALSLLAVLISCLGLLGMAAYTAETRAKEISIRKVVGSSVQQIMVLLSKGFVILLAISAVIAIPVAYIINNMWLRFFASRVSITPLTIIVSVLVMLIISLLTVFSQSWRAAFANPVKKLRSE